MSSHLTISYSGAAAAGTKPAVAAGTDAPADGGPLGFLASLVDQLLAGGTAAPTVQTLTNAIADIGTTALSSLQLGDTQSAKGDAPSEASDLLATLGDQLDALKAQLQSGEAVDPALGQQISASLQALSKLPALPTPDADLTAELGSLSSALAATSPDLSQQLKAFADKLGAAQSTNSDATTIAKVLRALLAAKPASKTEDGTQASAPTDPSGLVSPSASGLPPELSQLLASLGVTLPSAAEQPPTGATLSTLGDQLDALSKAVAAKSPELSQKLANVASALTAASSDPKLAGQFADAVQAGGATLDALVQRLAEPKPTVGVASQVAAISGLQIAATPGSGKTKTGAEPTAGTADTTTSTTAPASIKLTAVAVEPVAQVKPKPASKPDDKAAVLTAAITADKAAPTVPDGTTQAGAVSPLASQIGTAARALPAAYQPVANPVNMGQVAIEMMRQVQHGSSHFTIRLDPPELGRVDVKMHVDASGAVNARLTVERSETLDLFQRDKGALERALSQAGVEGGKANLEFSLKQNPFAGMSGGDQRPSQGQQGGYQVAQGSADDDLSAVPAITLYRGTASAGGINIFA